MTESAAPDDLSEIGRKLDGLEEDVERLYAQAPFGCHSVGADGLYAEINATELSWLGQPREALLGRHRPEEFLTLQSQALLRQHLELFGSAAISGMELELLGRDGKPRPVSMFRAPVRAHGANTARQRTMLFDISAQKDWREHQQIAAMAFETVVGTCVTGSDARVLRVNQAFTDLTGYSADEVVGQNLRLLRSGRHDAAFYAAMWNALGERGAWQGEIENRRKDGSLFTAWLNISAIPDADGTVRNYVGSMHDITASKAASDAMTRMAFIDPLTQLPNRRLLLDRLDQALATASRSRLSSALLFLDLDHFKAVNDTHGHHIGDLLLVETARRLQGAIRKGDTAARLGGDEFVLLLTALSPQAEEAGQQAGGVADKVLEALARPYDIAGLTLQLSASAGVRVITDSETAAHLLEQADAAMYAAKSAGRNGWRLYTPLH